MKTEIEIDGKQYTYLTEIDMIWTEALCDILKEYGIGYVILPVLGAGIAVKVGNILEKNDFYVQAHQAAEAEELLLAYFRRSEWREAAE